MAGVELSYRIESPQDLPNFDVIVPLGDMAEIVQDDRGAIAVGVDVKSIRRPRKRRGEATGGLVVDSE